MPRDPEISTIASPGAKGAFRRWFALLGGAIAWSAHLGLSWVIGEFGCIRELHHTHLLGLTLTAWLLLGLTLVCLLLAIAATWAGAMFGADRRALVEGEPRAEAARYVLRMGFILSGLFAIIILGQAIPLVFYLQRC